MLAQLMFSDLSEGVICNVKKEHEPLLSHISDEKHELSDTAIFSPFAITFLLTHGRETTT